MRRGSKRPRILVLLALLLLPTGVIAAAQAGDSGLSAEGKALLEEKQRLHALEESTFLPPGETVPPSPPAGPPSPEPPPKLEEGLFGEEQADFPSGHGWDFANVWNQVIDGQYVSVYAGAIVAYDTLEPTGDGIILVVVIDPPTWGHTFVSFDPPIAGPVTIESVEGHLLNIVSDSGETAVFDADAMAFVAVEPVST